MAGAGQPFYMPLTWPIGHVSSAIMKPDDDEPRAPSATPELDMIGHVTSMIAACRSFAMAYMCIFLFYGSGDAAYPAFGRAKEYDVQWMLPIVLRNVVATWLIAGLWDWFLYFSPLAKKLHKYKLNKRYPAFSQMRHDAIATTIASICGAAVEIVLCHYWATGQLAGAIGANGAQRPLFGGDGTHKTWVSVAWMLTCTHWRVPHFYVVHRMMHPWKNRYGPDVGAFLYTWVHKQHHKSHNPTAFSGTNMHPIEAVLYYSAALIPCAFGAHPAIAVACIIDCAVGAWLGHDGFQWPGSGDYFHQLHHAHFDCNYGAMHFPIDKWFGTFADSGKMVRQIWSDHKDGGGAKANGVHEPTLVANHARATASPRRTGPATQRDGTPLRRSVRRSGRKKSGEIVVH